MLFFSTSATYQQKWRLTGNAEEEKPRGIRILQLQTTEMVGPLYTSVTSWHLIFPVLSYLLFISENTFFYLLMHFCLQDITCIGNILTMITDSSAFLREDGLSYVIPFILLLQEQATKSKGEKSGKNKKKKKTQRLLLLQLNHK